MWKKKRLNKRSFSIHNSSFSSSLLRLFWRERERERERTSRQLDRKALTRRPPPGCAPKTMDGGSSSSAGGDVRLFFFHFFLGTVERIRSPFCLSPPHLSLTCNFPPLPISFNHSLAPPAPRRRLPRSAARSRTRSRCGREKEKERKKTSFFLLLHCRRRRRPFFFFFGLQRRTNGRA